MNNFKKYIVICVVAALLIFTFGVYMGAYHYSTIAKITPFPPTKELRLSGYKYISPILDYETDNVELKSFQKKVEGSVSDIQKNGRAGDIAVYFRDLNNGPWYGVNSGMDFSPASLLKVTVMMSYYEAAESNPNLLKEKMKYNRAEDSKEDTTLVSGKEYTVDELINVMIINSDNEAKSLLTSNPTIDFQKPYSDLGINLPILAGLDNTLSVKEYASFFRVLYNASYLNKEYSSKALELLTKTNFKDALRAGVPESIEVAHKYGHRVLPDGTQQLHDCGIVYIPNHPYLICIMTRGTNEDTLKTVIRDLSQLVYDEVHSQLNLSMKR